jgi:hypothetical protein
LVPVGAAALRRLTEPRPPTTADRYDRDTDSLLEPNERALLWHNREIGCADARWLALLVANTDAWRDDAEQDAAEV